MLIKGSYALTLYSRILVVCAVYVGFGAGLNSHRSERDALRTNTEIRAINDSNETQPAGTEYAPAHPMICSQKCLWWLTFHASRVSLDFAIVNSAGDDVSNSVSVFYHQPAPVSKLSKRTESRPIRDCPDGHYFLYSRCSRFHSIAQWSLVCRARQGFAAGSGLQWGECRTGEICVEGRSAVHQEDEGYYASTAWCVGKENFIQISKSLANGRSAGGSIQTGFHPGVGKQYSIEAVLASSDSLTPLIAQSLEIQAQTADIVGGVQAWRTLNGGDNQCSNCASVGISNVPVGTQRVRTHLEVKQGTVDGLLYLASVGI